MSLEIIMEKEYQNLGVHYLSIFSNNLFCFFFTKQVLKQNMQIANSAGSCFIIRRFLNQNMQITFLSGNFLK